ncbi:hypothetical protein JCM10207_001228 [Rhodosporidiobolus poonsookiae]
MPGLKQESVAKLLRRASTADEVEEVVAAYGFSKQLKGRNAVQVHRSLYLLGHYLNALGLSPLLKEHTSSFGAVASLAVSSVPISHVVTPTTPLGVEAWNEARRRPSGWLRRGNSSESVASFSSSSGASVASSTPPAVERQSFWRAFISVKPPTYDDNLSSYVDRDGDEGRQRVVQDNRRTALPTYA